MMDQQTPRDGYKPTTTHAEWGAGNPRLRVTRDYERFEFRIESDLVRVGSADGNELILAGTDPVHATVTHDERDEYVLTLHGEGEMSASPGTAGANSAERSETLRTGSRFTAGAWALVFARDEYADHGRPFGGRQGGELSDQRLQQPRPDYTGAAGTTDAPEAPTDHS